MMKRLISLVMVLMMLVLTGCSSNDPLYPIMDDMLSHISSDLSSVSSPDSFKIVHYRYEGRETIEAQMDGRSLSTAFPNASVPDNGHIFIYEGDHIFLVSDAGVVLDECSVSSLNATVASRNAYAQSQIRSLNDKAARGGKITDSERQRLMDYTDKTVDMSLQALVLATLPVCAALAPVSAKADANHWHELTEKQKQHIIDLCLK